MGTDVVARLDGHTVCATLSMLALVLAVLSLGAAQARDTMRRALLTWSASMGTASVAFALYMGRGTLPWLLSFHLGNAVVVLVPALSWLAMMQAQGPARRPLALLLPVLLNTGALTASALAGSGHAIALGVVCSSTAWLMAGTAWSAAASARRQGIRAAWLGAVGAGTNALCYALRAARALGAQGESLVSHGPIQSEAALALLLSTAFSVLGTIGMLGIAAELRQRQWQERMRRDALTGVLTRGAFFEQAEAVAASGRPFAVLMVDVDHFKAINDRHGHAGGDAVLAQVARRLDATLRAGDLLGRYGGEEFCVLLPDGSTAAAALIAERLVAAVGRTPLRIAVPGLPEGSTLDCTVSVGHATQAPGPGPAAAQRLQQGLQRADAALYRAKHLGRNRFEAAPDEAGNALRDTPPSPGRQSAGHMA